MPVKDIKRMNKMFDNFLDEMGKADLNVAEQIGLYFAWRDSMNRALFMIMQATSKVHTTPKTKPRKYGGPEFG